MISTDKQKEIMTYFSNGHTANTIGLEIGLSRRTVEKYVELMKVQHDALNVTNLVAIFFRKNLIS